MEEKACGKYSRHTLFKTKMLIYHSKANFDEKILFVTIIHLEALIISLSEDDMGIKNYESAKHA